MYLVQERQLKTHQLHSIFHHLPPLTDLFAAHHPAALARLWTLYRRA